MEISLILIYMRDLNGIQEQQLSYSISENILTFVCFLLLKPFNVILERERLCKYRFIVFVFLQFYCYIVFRLINFKIHFVGFFKLEIRITHYTIISDFHSAKYIGQFIVLGNVF